MSKGFNSKSCAKNFQNYPLIASIMAEPIKTTVQEALSHIKSWIDSGEKDKATKGLEEILAHEPGNTEAKAMLDGLNTSKPQAETIQQIVPGGAPVPVPVPAIPTPAVPSVTPATPTTPPTPVPTPPTPAVPPALSPMPVASATPAPSSTPSALGSPEAENKIAMVTRNIKWIILAGAVLSAVIGGYLFYRNFLSVPGQIIEDLQQEGERISTDFQAVLPVTTTETSISPEAPISSEPPVTPASPATTSSESGEKVKRR